MSVRVVARRIGGGQDLDGIRDLIRFERDHADVAFQAILAPAIGNQQSVVLRKVHDGMRSIETADAVQALARLQVKYFDCLVVLGGKK